MAKRATHRQSDGVWTLLYTIGATGDLIIYNYSPDDPKGAEDETELAQCKVIEDGNRIVIQVIICPTYKGVDQDYEDGLLYDVHNPKFVFQYSQDLATKKLRRAGTMIAKNLARKRRVQAESAQRKRGDL